MKIAATLSWAFLLMNIAYCGDEEIAMVAGVGDHESNYLIDVGKGSIVAITRNRNPFTVEERKKNFLSDNLNSCAVVAINVPRTMAHGIARYNGDAEFSILWDLKSKEVKKVRLWDGKYLCRAGAFHPSKYDVYALISCVKKEGDFKGRFQVVIYDVKKEKVTTRTELDHATLHLHGVTAEGEVLLTQYPKPMSYYRETKKEEQKSEDHQTRLVYLNPANGKRRDAKPPDLETLFKGEEGKPNNVYWWSQDNREYFLIALVGEKEKDIKGWRVITRVVGEEKERIHRITGDLFRDKKSMSIFSVPVVSGDGKAIYIVTSHDGKTLTRIDLNNNLAIVVDLEAQFNIWGRIRSSEERETNVTVSYDGRKIIYYGTSPYHERLPAGDRDDEIKRKCLHDIVIADGSSGKVLKRIWVPLEMPNWIKREEKK